MIRRRFRHTLDGLRHLGPYLAIELLLPGGTLVALLLWLCRRFYRNGLSDAFQHRFGPLRAKVTIMARPRPGPTRLCMCPTQAVTLSDALQSFGQWCDSSRVAMKCCA